MASIRIIQGRQIGEGEIDLYPLVTNFREALCDTPAPCPPQYRGRRDEPKGREGG